MPLSGRSIARGVLARRTAGIVISLSVAATSAGFTGCFGSVDASLDVSPISGAGGRDAAVITDDAALLDANRGVPSDGAARMGSDGGAKGTSQDASTDGVVSYPPNALARDGGNGSISDAALATDAFNGDGAPSSYSDAASDSHRTNEYWSETFGVANVPTRTYGLQVDRDGNILLLEKVAGTDFGDGPLMGTALVKFDPSGRELWSTAFDDVMWAIRVLSVDAAGNAIVCGGTAPGGIGSTTWGTVFVTKYDPGGTPIWNKSFDTLSTSLFGSCAADSAGNVYVGGRLYGTIDFGGGALSASDSGGDLMIAKLASADGSHIWSKTGKVPSGGGMVQSVSVDGSDNPIFTGWSAASFDFGDGPVPIAGGGDDAFIAKLTPQGSVTFAKMFGGSGMQECSGVADSVGGVALFGALYGSTIDFGDGPIQGGAYYARLDATNTPVYARPLVGTGLGPYPDDLIFSGSDVQTIGTFSGTTNLGLGSVTSIGDDIYVMRIGPTGTTIGVRTFARDGSNDSGSSFIGAEPNGDLIIAGSFPNTIDFGSGVLTAVGTSDLFLARIPP